MLFEAMDRFDRLAGREKITGNGLSSIVVGSDNTVFLADSTQWQNGVFLPDIPRKIRTKIKINALGLNQLPTSIVAPGVILSQGDLLEILDWSNQINSQLGLPNSKDIIIRTKTKTTPSLISNAENPVLIVKSVADSPEYITVGGKKNYADAVDFIRNLSDKTYLMIHDDNPRLEKNTLDGNFTILAQTTTLSLAKGVLNARLVDYRRDGKNQLCLSGRNPFFFPEVINSSIGVDVHRLATIALRWKETIEETYEIIGQHFGRECVMEFRIFSGINSLNSFQVLDVDQKF